MIYILLGLALATLWGMAAITIMDNEELAATDRCDVLDRFCGQFRWLGAIGRVSRSELNQICDCNR